MEQPNLLSSLLMDVFVVPVGPDKYELYCETNPDAPVAEEAVPAGFLGRLRAKFAAMLKAAEERQHRHPGEADPADKLSWAGRVQEHAMGWVAERIAEQRLLWNLRGQTTAVAAYPQDMSFEQVMTLINRIDRKSVV